MSFPRKPSEEPQTIDDHVNLLPKGLRQLLTRELAAGNAITSAGTGFPAAPVGIWLQLQKPFLTLNENPLPEKVTYTSRRDWQAPGECTDSPRHFFILSGPLPEPPPKPIPAPPPPFPPSPFKHSVPTTLHPKVVFDWREQAETRSFDLRVSAAIAKHLGLMSSKETDAAIIADIGADGLKRLNEIDAYANRQEFWTKTPHDRAYHQIQFDLKEKFPFLSPEAIQRLSTRAAWGWR